MKLLKNPGFARAAMIVIIVCAVLFGSHRSLSALRGEVEDVFFNGADGDGIGIARDLSKNRDSLYNLATVAQNYLDESAVQPAFDACVLADRSGSGESAVQARQAITDAAQALYGALEGKPLSEKDAGYRESLMDEIRSRNNTMSHDPYNQLAQNYNEQLSRFPAGLLSKLTAVKPAPLFR